MKTKSSAKKRFKVTGTGKIKRKHAFKSHILTKKSKKRHPFFIAYISIFLIWLLNLISIEIPKFMFELRVGIYVMSLVLYFVILQRIFKKRKK